VTTSFGRGPTDRQLAFIVNLLHTRELDPVRPDVKGLLARLRTPEEVADVSSLIGGLKALPQARPAEFRRDATWAELRRELRETIDALVERIPRAPWATQLAAASERGGPQPISALLGGDTVRKQWEPLSLAVEDVNAADAVEALAKVSMLLGTPDPESELSELQISDAKVGIRALLELWESRLD